MVGYKPLRGLYPKLVREVIKLAREAIFDIDPTRFGVIYQRKSANINTINI